MSEYTQWTELLKVGKELRYEGDDLKNFVEERQREARAECARVREVEYESRLKELEDREKERGYLQLEKEKETIHQLQLEQIRGFRDNSRAATHLESVIETPKSKVQKLKEQVDDVDAYLERFERYATISKCEKDNWVVYLSPLLTGKALKAYISLPISDASDYEIVKKAVLLPYMLTEEGYRNKFRDTFPTKMRQWYSFL